MKVIPRSYELSEDDIKEAIALWLNTENETDNYFDIAFKTETKETALPANAARGGMSDNYRMVVTAVAVEEE